MRLIGIAGGLLLASGCWHSALAQEDDYETCLALVTPICACDDTCDETRVGDSLKPVSLTDISTIDPIIVWGDRDDSAPGSLSRLYGFEVTDIRADHPAEVLNTLPGVNIQMNSGQEHLLAIRSPVLNAGAGQGSFLILENGVPTRSPAFGNVNMLLEPHHEVAEAIEVVRGPGSARYGSNAVHGLVNVIWAEPFDEDRSQFTLSGSTLDRLRADVVSADEADHGNTRLAASYMTEKGWRDDTGSTQAKVSAARQFEIRPDWTITAWAVATALQQETAGFIEGPKAYRDREIAKTNPNPEAYRDAYSARAAVSIEREFNDESSLRLTPFVRWQEMEFSQHFLPNGGVEDNGHVGTGLMLSYENALSEEVTLTLGGDLDFARGYLKEVQLEPFGFFPGDPRFPQGVHYDYTVETQMGAVWGEVDWAFTENFRVLAGLRAETHGYEYETDAPVGINGRFNVVADRRDDFSFVTPKLGVVWDASNSISFYTNYTRGARAPQASDLYRLQSQQIAGEVEVETLDSLEIGARGSALDGRLLFDVAAYAMDKDNFYFRDSDRLNVPNGSTRHIGLEGQGVFDITETLRLQGNVAWSEQTYTFTRVTGSASETITDGNDIDTAPEWLGDFSVIWTPDDQFELAVSAEYVGEYFTNPANTRTYTGHTLTNVRATYQFENGIEVFGIVRNLFDLEYADRADFAFGSERYFPGEPLNLTVGIRKTLGGNE
ncbi:MAG: TonB-dependent receptor [Pseudomonadota bacterium]